MNHVICSPVSLLPRVFNPSIKYFSLFSPHHRVGHIAASLQKDVRRAGIAPSIRVWDFATIALAVAAADLSCQRTNSADGWTREIKLDIHLHEPEPWIEQKTKLESTFRFLTGDFWALNFLAGGELPPNPKKHRTYDADCVSLVSGGLDSLVGAIDLTFGHRKPIFVSQIVRGDKDTQEEYATTLGARDRFCQWSAAINVPDISERSTRGRSIVFFAFAAIAACSISSEEDSVEIYVPENGFISLNVPLNAGRMGSLSTKTTHPVYVNGIQSVWDSVGIKAKLVFPYQFKTKGELLTECSDRNLLLRLAGKSTSCGKFAHHQLTHCGRCMPCLVRRAAFLKTGITDPTIKGYVYTDLSHSGKATGSNDIGAVAAAYLQCQAQGVRHFLGSALSFAEVGQRPQYESVIERGLNELGKLLVSHHVL